MNSPSFPIDKGKFFLQLGDDLHSFLGIKKPGSRAALYAIVEQIWSVTKHPINAIHRLDHRGMLIVAIDIASVDDRWIRNSRAPDS